MLSHLKTVGQRLWQSVYHIVWLKKCRLLFSSPPICQKNFKPIWWVRTLYKAKYNQRQKWNNHFSKKKIVTMTSTYWAIAMCQVLSTYYLICLTFPPGCNCGQHFINEGAKAQMCWEICSHKQQSWDLNPYSLDFRSHVLNHQENIDFCGRKAVIYFTGGMVAREGFV